MGVEVLRLEDIRRGDIAIAGGKGANLGELIGKGFPVPPANIATLPRSICRIALLRIKPSHIAGTSIALRTLVSWPSFSRVS